MNTNNKRKTEHNLDPHGGDPDGEEIESTLKVRRDYWRRCLLNQTLNMGSIWSHGNEEHRH